MGSGRGVGLSKRCWAYGDSYTDGSTIQGFFQNYIFQVAQAQNLDLIHRSYGGSMLGDDQQIGRMLNDPICNGDRVIFLAGYNDMRRYGRNTSAHAAYDVLLRQALQRWSEAGVHRVYLGGCLKMMTGAYSLYTPFNNGSDDAAADYTGILTAAAASFANVTYVDTSSWNPNTAGFIQGDSVHPTKAGFDALAAIFNAVVT